MNNEIKTYFSLCQGIGGFDDAFDKFGFEKVGGCEINEYARGISFQKYKGHKIWGDARTVDTGELQDFDLLTCGFPCPSFSICGQRKGFDDERGQIFYQILRFAKAKRPKMLLLENVKGILSHQDGQTFGKVLVALASLGYVVQWQVINSKFYVPQNRERVFIAGYLGRECPREIFPIGQENGRTSNKIKKVVDGPQGMRVYDTSGINQCLASQAGGGGAKMGMVKVLSDNILCDHPKCECSKKESETTASPVINTKELGIQKLTNDRANCLTATYYKGYDNHGNRTMVGIYETCKMCNGVIGKIRIRKLTPKECERLQGFEDDSTKYGLFKKVKGRLIADPDGEKMEISDTQRYIVLGNAVTVPVIEDIARRIKEI